MKRRMARLPEEETWFSGWHTPVNVAPSDYEDAFTYMAYGDFQYPSVEIQSEETNILPKGVLQTPGAGMKDQETVCFVDQTTGLSVGDQLQIDDLGQQDAADAAGLANFLSRPTTIFTVTWAETDPLGSFLTINPWQLFLQNAVIARKLYNFAFIRGNLKIKVLINASPFYYGAMYMSYQPLQNFTPTTIITSTSLQERIPISQRPGFWILPQNNEGGELTLPFFYPKNFLRLGYNQDTIDMGQLNFYIYSALQSANAVVAAGVSIKVLAWMEDVTLSGPTVDVQFQSEEIQIQADEYAGDGQISGPATAVARYARYFTGIPIIGSFAKATQIGANAISGIASLFGYTNVPNISDAQAFRPQPYPQFASPEIGYPVEKLTLDPKNELTLDPKITGYPCDKDELSIQYLACRESYLCTTTWATADASDKILFSSRVTPFQYDYFSAVNNSKIYMTPLGWITNCFRHWRGDIIFRFRVICSQYHKGRIRISFDPAGKAANSLLNTSDSTQAVFTKIIDIGEEHDVELRVPYQQALPFLQCNTGFSASNVPWSTSAAPVWSGDDAFDNGVITVRVYNALTAPVLTSSVQILVYVRGADNIEYANPQNVGNSFTPFAIQSEERDVPPSDTYQEDLKRTEEHIAGKGLPIVTPDRYLINFGEVVRSLRPLLRRMNMNEVYIDTTVGANALTWIRFDQTRFPLYYGYDPAGVHSAKGLVVPASNFNFNYVQNSFYHWLAPAFIGQRGSMNWTYTADGLRAIPQMLVTRVPHRNITAANLRVSQASGTVSANARFYFQNVDATQGGTSATSQLTNAGLSVQMPNYTGYKFQSTNPLATSNPQSSTTASNYDGGARDGYRVFVSTNDSASGTDSQDVKVWKYSGIGTDYNLYFFLNTPVFYNITSVPAAN